MNKWLKNYFFVLLLPSFLCSCRNTNEYVSLDQYEIKESQTLKEQRVGRASDVWNLNILVPSSIAPSWSFKTTPVILLRTIVFLQKKKRFLSCTKKPMLILLKRKRKE